MDGRSDPTITAYVGRDIENGDPIRVGVAGGRVTSIERPAASPDGIWISPGWLDIQVNGYGGHDPNDAEAGAAATAAATTASTSWPPQRAGRSKVRTN